MDLPDSGLRGHAGEGHPKLNAHLPPIPSDSLLITTCQIYCLVLLYKSTVLPIGGSTPVVGVAPHRELTLPLLLGVYPLVRAHPLRVECILLQRESHCHDDPYPQEKERYGPDHLEGSARLGP